MVAQSLINEGCQHVVFVCSTVDLVEQTAREAERLGLNYSLRTGGKFSSDQFETGKAFCITTYASLFTHNTPFKKFSLGGIVFDDAHVAERLVRDSFTISVRADRYPNLYADLIEIIRPEFTKIKKDDHLKYILDDISGATTLCPPATAFRNASAIIETFKRHNYRKYEDLLFPVIQLYENIRNCAVYVSPNSIEICPPFIPNQSIEHVQSCKRRIYLSATLDYATDFIRAFGVSDFDRIEPDNDAGNGERVIILASMLADPDGKLDLAAKLEKSTKLVVAIPSYEKAKQWVDICSPPTVENFSEELNKFRNASKGVFCLVSRIDGIDLPQDTCRIMIIDGSPSGSNLQEKYQVNALHMHSQNSTKMSTRITQLLGRINRGRSDYGAFILYGNDINAWCKNDRNIALLPALIRKQFLLGQSLQEQIGPSDNDGLNSLINNILGTTKTKIRDKEWLKFYSETIDGLEIEEDSLLVIREREEKLAQGALAENKFMSALWYNDTDKARQEILSVIDAIAPVDSKLAGWYDLWVGMTYEIDGDEMSAGTHYARARSRLIPRLNVPLISKYKSDQGVVEAKNPVHRKLSDLNLKGGKAFTDLARDMRRNIGILTDSGKSSNQREEACRMIGELIGFDTARPDNVFQKGPDVVWSSEDDNCLIGFELKTQKISEEPKYKKDLVGQCLNHIEWIKGNYSEYQFNGILVVGPKGVVTANSSPGGNLYHITSKEMGMVLERFLARIEDLVGKTSLERWHMITELGNLPEYQIFGWSTVLTPRLLKDLMP